MLKEHLATPPAKPIFPWFGGKRRLAKDILPLFPEHHCYVEPFAGGAALFFLKDRSRNEILNDINGDICNLYLCVKKHFDEVVKQFKWCITSHEMYERAQQTPRRILTDIEKAARFLYIQHLNFSALPTTKTFGTGPYRGAGFNLVRLEENLSAAHLRLQDATIENLSWERCIKVYDRPDTLFYFDPPYLGFDKEYGVSFPREEYRKLADALRTMKGKAIVSVSDRKEMREDFKGLRIKKLLITYTAGAGLGKGRKASELVIRNF